VPATNYWIHDNKSVSGSVQLLTMSYYWITWLQGAGTVVARGLTILSEILEEEEGLAGRTRTQDREAAVALDWAGLVRVWLVVLGSEGVTRKCKDSGEGSR
jgi:hypothetical protein